MFFGVWYLAKLLLMTTMRYDFNLWRAIHNERLILLLIFIFFFFFFSSCLILNLLASSR